MLKTLGRAALAALALLALAPAHADAPKSQPKEQSTYDDDEVLKAAEDFFSTGAKGLGEVLEKVLKEKGHPVAIIRGEEIGGAIGVGLRYGHGRISYKGESGGQKVYWQGPSIGFDVGANAVKVFTLVYGLPGTSSLFQRYPGVEGSLYFVGGFGVNYVQSGSISLAPVRFGVGWRQGIDVGYMNFSPKKRYNPF